MRKLIFIWSLFLAITFAQSKDADTILNNVKEEFSKINDYVVDVNVSVDIEFLKVPDAEATIYYKKPDKVRVKSDKFALLPKEGLDFSPLGLLENDYQAFYQKEDTIDGHKVSVVKVIPLNDKSNVILSTFYIDQEKNIIRKVETSTKVGGSYTIEMKYDFTNKKYYLPDTMIFSFNLSNLNIPKSIDEGFDTPEENEKKEKNKNRNTTGKVIISYKNYKVNKGIPDSVFEKENE